MAFDLNALVNLVCILTCDTCEVFKVITQLNHPISTKIICAIKKIFSGLIFLCNCDKFPCIRDVQKNHFDDWDQCVILVVMPTRPLPLQCLFYERVVVSHGSVSSGIFMKVCEVISYLVSWSIKTILC